MPIISPIALSAASKGKGTGGYTIVNSELTTYIAGLSTALSATQILALDTLVTSLKTGLSITTLDEAFDTFWVLAGETEESSYKNLVKNDHHCTKNNTPIWTQFEGSYSATANHYLKTNYLPTDWVRFCPTVVSPLGTIGFYSRTNIAGYNWDIGHSISGEGAWIMSNNGGSLTSRIASTGVATIANANTLGSIFVERSSTTNINLYKNGLYVNNASISYTYSGNVAEVYIHCHTNDTVNISKKQFSFAFFGKAFSAAQMLSIHNAMEAYMDANGKGVV